MKFVKATSASVLKNIKIKELGRVAHVDETFWVTDERFEVLAGKNKYKLVFVTLVDKAEEVVKQTKQTVTKHEDTVKIEEPEEEAEIILIKPGEKPVRVDENLNPIEQETPPVEEVQEEVVEETPKKKRGRRKKVTSEATE